jgi:hypothetical protein
MRRKLIELLDHQNERIEMSIKSPGMSEPITPIRKHGNEPIIGPCGGSISTLIEFWQWSASNILDNTLRGVFAEFLVARSLGIHHQHRVQWEPFDLRSNEGVRIEVKSAAYVQSWKQKQFSTISFDISPTSSWDKQTKRYSDTKQRRSDLYIFCLLGSPDSWDVNPLDLNQWTFFTLATTQLDAKLPTQKRISLSRLERLGAKKCNYSQLSDAVLSASVKQDEAT